MRYSQPIFLLYSSSAFQNQYYTFYSLHIHLSVLLPRRLIKFNRGHSNYFATSQSNWSSAEGIVLKNHMNTANIVFGLYN